MTRPDLPNCRCKHWDGDNIDCPYHGGASKSRFERDLSQTEFSDKQTEILGVLLAENNRLQKRIDELELANAIAWGNAAEPAEIVAQHNRIVMQHCATLCLTSGCDTPAMCADAIRKEMEGLSDD